MLSACMYTYTLCIAILLDVDRDDSLLESTRDYCLFLKSQTASPCWDRSTRPDPPEAWPLPGKQDCLPETRPGTALAKPVDGASSWTVFPASEGAAGDFE